MNNIITIMKKELRRFFTDKRLLLTLLLPGIVIFVVYSLIGQFLTSSFIAGEDHIYSIYTLNAPDALGDILGATGLTYKFEEVGDPETAKEAVKEKDYDLFVEFEENFTSKVAGDEKPYVKIWYNDASTESFTAYNAVYSAIYGASVEITERFTVNAGGEDYDLATDEETAAMIMTMMLPFILIIFLFTGSMAVATESIAGEKERGTIATLLVTPVKRSHIALGKILALSITAIVSALASFAGLVASLPRLMAGAGEINLAMYGVGTYLGTLGVIAVTVILFTVILSVISALAKSVKEASQLALPVMMLVMLVGVTSMIGRGQASAALWVYLIPVYNSVQCLAGLFSLSFDPISYLITVLSNVIFIALGIILLAKIFNSEKIIFNK